MLGLEAAEKRKRRLRDSRADRPAVLISGAGIARSTLAFLRARRGFRDCARLNKL